MASCVGGLTYAVLLVAAVWVVLALAAALVWHLIRRAERRRGRG